VRKVFLGLILMALLASPVYAAKSNIWASWYTVVGTSETSISLPVETLGGADIEVINDASGYAICVSFKGEAIGSDCKDTSRGSNPTITMLDTNESLSLYDFVTDSIKLRTMDGSGSASPVSVIITY